MPFLTYSGIPGHQSYIIVQLKAQEPLSQTEKELVFYWNPFLCKISIFLM